ncbi:hypothetical protein A2U01_0066196, partial [Trifolium medium]|nr:hypothetical protein [Trifolium medium]
IVGQRLVLGQIGVRGYGEVLPRPTQRKPGYSPCHQNPIRIQPGRPILLGHYLGFIQRICREWRDRLHYVAVVT